MAKIKKKNNMILLLLILLVSISVGYAAFAQTLNISGTATANGNFKLKFTSVAIDPNIGAENSTASISANGETLSIDMQLKYPGAGGKITATITNSGNIAAKLNNVNFTELTNTNIIVTLERDAIGDVIQPNETRNVIITVKWDENSTVADSVSFNATLDYVQSTTNFIDNTTNDANNG